MRGLGTAAGHVLTAAISDLPNLPDWLSLTQNRLLLTGKRLGLQSVTLTHQPLGKTSERAAVVLTLDPAFNHYGNERESACHHLRSWQHRRNSQCARFRRRDLQHDSLERRDARRH